MLIVPEALMPDCTGALDFVLNFCLNIIRDVSRMLS